MERQEKAAMGGKHRRSTVGNRLGGGGGGGNKNNQQTKQQAHQTQTQIEEVVPQLEHLTKILKDVVLNQNQQQQGDGAGRTAGNGNGGPNRAKQGDLFQEVRFEPPWDCKLGQMQQVVRALQRHTNNLLDNRNSVIIRCFPYKSPTYMHMVYNLIYDTLHTNQQYGPALQAAPTEIRPILLHYDDNGMPNPVQHPPALYSTIPQLNPQPDWTDIVLVRVRFDQQNPAVAFLANFNRNAGRVFDRTKVRCPFAHPDLTQPERILRHRLQQICMEKNGRFNRRPVNRFRLNFQYQQPEQTNERYFHNGLQIYKQHSNGWTEPVQFENYTELQCLHVVVASMRKYASMYRQKQTSVIIQNVELEELNEADMERITALVYSVVNTDIYRQRCQAIQERSNKFRNNAQNTASNITTTSTGGGGGGSLGAGGNQHRSGGGSASSNEFLPAKIERIPRRKKAETTTEGGGGGKTTSSAQGSPKKKGSRGSEGDKEGEDNGNGKKEGGGNDQEKKKKDEEDQAMTTTAAETTGEKSETATAVVVERPPLVRIQFCNKESATAFCQLFKLTQQHQKKIEEEKRAAEEEHGGGGHSTADSYSDLSDLEEVFGSENEDDSDDAEKDEGEGQNSGEKTSNDDNKDEEGEGKKAAKKKKNGKKQQRRHHHRHHQAKMCLYFPNSFAHRDLTPPELALGYALRQYCREKNAEVEGVASSMNVASGSTSADAQQPAWKQRRFFTRIGRIYERKGTAE